MRNPPLSQAYCLLLTLLCLLAACSPTSTHTTPATLGQVATFDDLKRSFDAPGKIVFTKHVAGDWAVNLSGLLNLEHPKAQAAGIEDRLEPIQVYTYSLEHPEFGTFLVDSGLSTKFLDPANNSDLSFLVKQVMGMEHLVVKLTTRDLVDQLGGIDGVFLSHIHMDHIMGLTDIASQVPVYIGPGDATYTDPTHIATRGTTDRLLGNVEALQIWSYDEGDVIDVFGDGSLWAIHSPGHTPGTTAYLANTTEGPQLMLGDVTHTKWGWLNGVEPGTFSSDVAASAVSLARLKSLVGEHGEIAVHPGHQSL